MKTCSTCKILKPLSEFSTDKGRIDKKSSNCTLCRSESVRKRKLERLHQGLCISCGLSNEESENKYCNRCKKIDKERRRSKTPWPDCAVCGFPYADIHHQNGDKFDNRLSNLVPLCPNHHRLVHLHVMDCPESPYTNRSEPILLSIYGQRVLISPDTIPEPIPYPTRSKRTRY